MGKGISAADSWHSCQYISSYSIWVSGLRKLRLEILHTNRCASLITTPKIFTLKSLVIRIFQCSLRLCNIITISIVYLYSNTFSKETFLLIQFSSSVILIYFFKATFILIHDLQKSLMFILSNQNKWVKLIFRELYYNKNIIIQDLNLKMYDTYLNKIDKNSSKYFEFAPTIIHS